VLPDTPRTTDLHLLAEAPTPDGQSSLLHSIEKATRSDPFAQRIISLLHDGKLHSKEISLSECDVRDGWLYYQQRLYIPNDDNLRLRLLQSHHDAPAVGHPGRAKTFDLLQRCYYWPTLRRDVERYVANCHTCKRTKTSCHLPYGVLHPLPAPERPWKDIAMDFFTGLPTLRGHDAIWVVVDRLTKMRHFIPCSTTIDAEGLANLFMTHIFRLHSLPDTIVSDRGPQFASRFWKHLCYSLKIEPRLSMAFHPETDGQTERMNSIMEQYLRAYVNYQQDNWAQLLPIAEFAANNHTSETTGLSPFFSNYGFHPKLDLEPDIHVDHPKEGQARRLTDRLNEIHDFAKNKMTFAQDHQQEYADKHQLPAPAYLPRDLVWLNAKNLRTNCPSRKLDYKRHGPFPIIKEVGKYAYELELPPTMNVHPVFHVSLLEPVRGDPMPGQQLPPPEPVIIDREPEYEVEDVIDSRIFRRRLQYLIKWRGWNDLTWEQATEVNKLKAIDDFHAQHPNKPSPLPEDLN
jgi:transposase InsO family protein